VCTIRRILALLCKPIAFNNFHNFLTFKWKEFLLLISWGHPQWHLGMTRRPSPAPRASHALPSKVSWDGMRPPPRAKVAWMPPLDAFGEASHAITKGVATNSLLNFFWIYIYIYIYIVSFPSALKDKNEQYSVGHPTWYYSWIVTFSLFTKSFTLLSVRVT